MDMNNYRKLYVVYKHNLQTDSKTVIMITDIEEDAYQFTLDSNCGITYSELEILNYYYEVVLVPNSFKVEEKI